MIEKDNIKDLFQEKLSQLETPVRPEIWSTIASSIATTSGTAASGMSLLAKITIGITIAASVTGAVIFLSKDKSKETPKIEVQKTNDQKEIKSNTIENKSENNSPISKSNNPNSENRGDENHQTEHNNSIELVTESFSTSENKLVEEPTPNVQIEIKEELNTSESNSKSEPNSKIQKQESTLNTTSETLPEESKVQFKLPNIFTPNGDGNNDYLKLEIENVTEFVIVILDAKSNVVFKSENLGFKWDGTNFNGDKLPTGNYIYYVTAIDLEGKSVTKYSSLTIKY